MRLTTTVIAILVLFTSAGRKDESAANELLWSKHRLLGWEDFRGKINPASFGDAASVVSIRATPYRKNKHLHYDVNAIFLRHQSWCKSPSHNLLSHEQLHFDIAELYARKVRQKISAYKKAGIRDVAVYNKAIRQILEESNQTDRDYDHQTLHGALRKSQSEWENRIRIELMIMDRFHAENWTQ